MKFFLPSPYPDPLDQLPPPKKRQSTRIRAKAPDFPIPTPPELKEWANRNRQVRIAISISNTQEHIVSPYSDEQDPPLMVLSCSMGTPTSSSDDGPLTPDSDDSQNSRSIPGFGYFSSQKKAEVEDDQDEDGLFLTIGKKSTSTTRAPYRSVKRAEEVEVKVHKVQAKVVRTEYDKMIDVKEEEVKVADIAKDVKASVEVEEVKSKAIQADEVRVKEVEVHVVEGVKVVDRPLQTLPPPEWTGGQEWRKFRYVDEETSESTMTFNIHAWGAAKRAAEREEEESQNRNRSAKDINDDRWRDVGKLTSLGMTTCMIFASIPRLYQFVQTGFDIEPVEWTIMGSSFAFFVASVCGVIC